MIKEIPLQKFQLVNCAKLVVDSPFGCCGHLLLCPTGRKANPLHSELETLIFLLSSIANSIVCGMTWSSIGE